jgi:ribosomal protein S18 acetylase RimI-like enzyme
MKEGEILFLFIMEESGCLFMYNRKCRRPETAMIYYRDEHIVIRDMAEEDAAVFAEEERKQGWNHTEEKYMTRMDHRDRSLCIALTAEYDGSPAGYISVYPKSIEGPFGHKDLPEIVDFGVLEKYRRRGIGSALMDEAEKIASKYADMVYLGVGLHKGYGSAQRMYVKRGYVPEGSGVWHRDQPCTPYESYPLDDDLYLWLCKTFRTKQKESFESDHDEKS